MTSTLARCVLATLNEPTLVDPGQSSIPIDQLLSYGNSFDASHLQSESIFTSAAKMIENAQHTVEIITYWFDHDCDAAKCIAVALRNAEFKRRQLFEEDGIERSPLQVRTLANHSGLGGETQIGRGSMRLWTE
jgi:hypothetical protein